ncbi:phospho-sugar mutase [Tessaracoccus sp. MC1865]|uniref:phospho-sugar mutase n=1 Tax=Tessaracoccus sp. MC1865 TaxID=2760310 RepID=UPI0016038B1D|nr:phospho-sugar mutase [Tessaracoccus sp. MC1865]MBB1484533.1 phospho-sugar mutase [Tessaracoccus sp. MC1865]QTO38369.1 phospho-sugar mutase [Tessaracoccus sp. MC1865]
MQDLLNAAIRWRDMDPDPETREQLDHLIVQAQANDPTFRDAAEKELKLAFAGPLEFGTAGLRGALGPGPARMNRSVVTQAAAGFAAWLKTQGHDGGKVIVGYDARHKSTDFAEDTARVMAGAGFEVLWVTQPTPTPVIAFGIQHFGCVAGVVVTASHNPPQDNGYKVYLGDGSQIVPPTDAEIAAEIAKVAARDWTDLPRGAERTDVTAELRRAYVARAVTLYPADAPRDVVWVHTAMHGVGTATVRAVAEAVGLPAANEVGEQSQPDPNFPTVAFPNPEEKGAIDLAVALAADKGADVVIANDPDADRCAVAAVVDGQWRMLTGDELGSLLGDDAVRRGVPGRFANSVVSSTELGRMARAAGRPHVTTLTGFKWIGRVADLAFGYEEAIGYCCDSRAVPDKDGITAALSVLRIVAGLKAEGRTLADRLAKISRTHGLTATSQLSVRVADLSLIADAMARLRADPPAALLGEPVVVADLAEGSEALPPTDAVELTGGSVHVVARPSGTEPKLKCYLEVRLGVDESQDVPAARVRAAEKLVTLRREMAAALGVEA